MKKAMVIISIVMLALGLICPLAGAEEISNAELLKELKALRERVKFLEKRVQELEGPPQVAAVKPEEKQSNRQDNHYHSVRGIPDRVRRIEEVIEQKTFLPKWAKRFHFSGLLEVEANYEKMNYEDSSMKDFDSSDIVLATAELDIDVDIAKYVQGHIAFLWEEDDTEPVDIDEAFIMIDGRETVPFYMVAGKFYVPFGYFESHFISDPITLELGETNQSGVKVGFDGGWIDISGAVFNGDVDKKGRDDHIDNFVGAIIINVPEKVFPDLNISSGISYMTNIADSDNLQDEMSASTIRDYVDGLGAFISVSYRDKYFLELEYVGALDQFGAGELSFDGGGKAKPETWNMEFALRAIDRLEIALKYEGGNDLNDFLPESQYGAALIYDLFENTSLSLEYLHGKFENDDKRDVVTGQVAVQF